MKLSVKVQKKFPSFTLDVSWDAYNEISVLFGSSGAGKSMTLNHISGFSKPDTGQIIYGDKVYYDSDLKIDIPPQKRPFGYVFQTNSLFPHMTVEENICYGLKDLPKKEKKERVMEIAEQMQLKSLLHRSSQEISGGQKQRVALARSLVRKPELLLLDEPFSSLDTPIRIEMQNLLRDIRDNYNIPIVLITHDILEARRIADRVIIYSEGRILQDDTIEEVFRHPNHVLVEQLIQPYPFLDISKKG
ncbi:MAG: ATP-binding cassette domain-containing protein [Leptospiraceae bacterium]|nr:ATP-binding cassette domain-containing protein [Leptospiraceae bacterium]MCP5499469.1 ATP-binding cassette domain-containing protein [Leptospiraceae bacterium]